MVLAMAALLFQFPAPTVTASLSSHLNSGTRVESVAPARANAASSPTSAITKAPTITVRSDKTTYALPSHSLKSSYMLSVELVAGEGASAPLDQPIIHDLQPPAVSLASLTGPSLAELVLPPPAAAFRPPYELPVTHRRFWLALTTAEHSAATYDAWSTRYALSHGHVEADPLMRPFAGSSAIYPAIQLIPFGLDYLAHRFQRSSGWRHRVWWLPQSVATATFLFSGSYNVAHTN